MHPTRRDISAKGERGFSLVELMVAMTIGSILAAGLVIIFANTMQANREQFKAAQQIENGRYAIDLMVNDLRLAGYYGEFATLPPVPAALPDPCTIPSETTIEEDTANSAFALHVQGYAAANLTSRPSVPTNCATLLDNATLRPGSDIVVIRRLDTKPLIDPPTTSAATPVAGEVYAQTNNTRLDIQYGSGSAITVMQNAKGNDTDSSLCRKDYSRSVDAANATSAICPFNVATARPRIAAPIRKVHIHIYFVANCRKGSGANGQCANGDDSIPTLKRIELKAEDGDATMKIVPLVEGIEFLKIRYGLDTASHIAGQTFDGSVDSLAAASAVSLADWQNVVMMELRLLARNNEATNNYTDTKTYNLGVANYTPSGDDAKYKRHAYVSQVYVVNVGGRRES